jgi:hypothetical protein
MLRMAFGQRYSHLVAGGCAGLGEVRSPAPTLKTWPDTRSGATSADIKFTSITFSTWVKSRVCSPSPFIVGEHPSSAIAMNRGIATEYWEFRSWRSPNTLK